MGNHPSSLARPPESARSSLQPARNDGGCGSSREAVLEGGRGDQGIWNVELRGAANAAGRFRDDPVHRELVNQLQRTLKTWLMSVATGEELAAGHDRDLPGSGQIGRAGDARVDDRSERQCREGSRSIRFQSRSKRSHSSRGGTSRSGIDPKVSSSTRWVSQASCLLGCGSMSSQVLVECGPYDFGQGAPSRARSCSISRRWSSVRYTCVRVAAIQRSIQRWRRIADRDA